MFVHISAVERAGLTTLNEGQHVDFEIEENRGKASAVNLKVRPTHPAASWVICDMSDACPCILLGLLCALAASLPGVAVALPTRGKL